MSNNAAFQSSLSMLEKRNNMMIEQARADGVIAPAEEKFLALLKDEVFGKELANCASAEEVKELMDKNGVDFSMEYIQEMLVAIGKLANTLEANNGELSEEELEQIAGGWSWGSFWRGAVAIGCAVAAVSLAVASVVVTGGSAAIPLIAAGVGGGVGGVVGGVTEKL